MFLGYFPATNRPIKFWLANEFLVDQCLVPELLNIWCWTLYRAVFHCGVQLGQDFIQEAVCDVPDVLQTPESFNC